MNQNKAIKLPDTLIFTSEELTYEVSICKNDNGTPIFTDKDQPAISNKQILKNKNKVFQIIEGYKRCKKIKNCAHLSISINKYSCYHPICAHQSLNFDG